MCIRDSRYGTSNITGFDEYDKEAWERRWSELKYRNYDLVIHAGANSMAWYDKPDIFWSNHESTRAILEHCLTNKTHLIYFSSCAALDPVNLKGSFSSKSVIKSHSGSMNGGS